jgi:hypothetical protein
MGEQLPDFQQVISDGTNSVAWTKLSGLAAGDYFYISVGLPTYAAVLGPGTLPTITVSGPGTKISIRGTVDTDTTYTILSFHGMGKARRFA